MQGPASRTVTGSSSPVSENTCVIPIFLASRPLVAISSELDLDVDPGGQVQPHQGIDHFGVGIQDVDDALVGTHLELLPRVLIDERSADHRPPVGLGGQRNGAGRGCVGPPARMANRIPSSTAIGVIREMCIRMLSPGMTISVPSGSTTSPVTSVGR